MRFPIIWIAICFALGILARTIFNFDPGPFYLILIVAFVTACVLIKKDSSPFLIYSCLFLIGVIVVSQNLRQVADSPGDYGEDPEGS